MSGEIYIARTQYWSAKDNPIKLEEWLAVCALDESLRIQSELRAVNPMTGEEICILSPGYAFFTHPVDGECYSFEYRNGKLISKYDERSIAKAIELANRLGATVQDEDGEPVLA